MPDQPYPRPGRIEEPPFLNETDLDGLGGEITEPGDDSDDGDLAEKQDHDDPRAGAA